jgi:DMSO/TMAO reductase YedYZ molybdopterin-dependent catalytic subunit
MRDITRRKFIELALSGAAGALLTSCLGRQPGPTPVPTGDIAPTIVPTAEMPPTPEPTVQIIPSPTPTLASAMNLIRGQMVQNENRPDRNIRYFKPFVPPTPEEWRLVVNGLVSTPMALDLTDVQQLPVAEQTSRMVCVEGWSWKADWSGFTLAALMDQVSPQLDGQFVRFTCGDGYWEVLPVEDLTRDRVLLAYRIDGGFLPDPYGSPLRLIVPWKYGYKGAKCITGMEFVSGLSAGYWPTVGPYSAQGDIQPGFDRPQETNTVERITEVGKEVTY